VSELDDAIRNALSEEDAEFLARMEKEPSYPQMMLGVFKGPWGPVNIILLLLVVPILGLAIWTIMEFLNADDVQEMFRWFAGAALSVAVLFMVRFWLVLSMQFDRVIREVKRIELQMAFLASRKPD
jgi:hypothetical protein